MYLKLHLFTYKENYLSKEDFIKLFESTDSFHVIEEESNIIINYSHINTETSFDIKYQNRKYFKESYLVNSDYLNLEFYISLALDLPIEYIKNYLNKLEYIIGKENIVIFNKDYINLERFDILRISNIYIEDQDKYLNKSDRLYKEIFLEQDDIINEFCKYQVHKDKAIQQFMKHDIAIPDIKVLLDKNKDEIFYYVDLDNNKSSLIHMSLNYIRFQLNNDYYLISIDNFISIFKRYIMKLSNSNKYFTFNTDIFRIFKVEISNNIKKCVKDNFNHFKLYNVIGRSEYE